MAELFVALFRLLRSVCRAGADPEFRALLSLMIVLLVSGAVFYRFEEGWGYVDSLYFCVMTMATVGYGDLSPTSSLSKVFTVVYTLTSIGVFVGVATKLAEAMLRRSRHKHSSDQPR